MSRGTANLLWGVLLTLATHATLFGVVAGVGPPAKEARPRPPVRIRLIAPAPPKLVPPPPKPVVPPEPPKVLLAKAQPEPPRVLKKREPEAKGVPPQSTPPPSAPPPPVATIRPLEPAPGPPSNTGIAIPVSPEPAPPAKPQPSPRKAVIYTAELDDGTGDSDGQRDGSGDGRGPQNMGATGELRTPKPDKPERGKPVDPASVTQLPGLRSKPSDDELRAAYPEGARQRSLDGNVGMEILVDEEGRVTNARVTRPAGNGFDAVALRFIRKHRFRPATRNGQPVTVWIPWLYKFRIGNL